MSKILIVEDEMIVQMHLKRIVEGIGHEVTATATGLRDAIAAADIGRALDHRRYGGCSRRAPKLRRGRPPARRLQRAAAVTIPDA